MGKFTFGKSGASYECDKVDLRVHEGAPKCPRCSERVYFNEEKKALGKTWHSQCFTCCQCKKTLSSTNYNDYNDEIICTACLRRFSSTVTSSSGASSPAFVLSRPGFATGSGSATPTHDIDSAPRLQFSRSTSSVPGQTTAIVNRDDPECCPYCGKRVYFAEELKATKRKWHKLCFKCVTCKKTLEPGRFTEHDSLLYCQTCYSKQFGPQGYGYAGGLGSLLSTDPVAFRQHYTNGTSYTLTDAAFTTLNGREVQHSKPMEPIQGTQEWTESIFIDRP